MIAFRCWLMILLSEYIYIYIRRSDYTQQGVCSRSIWKIVLNSADDRLQYFEAILL